MIHGEFLNFLVKACHCVYIYIYIYIYIYMYIYIYIYTHTHTHTHIKSLLHYNLTIKTIKLPKKQ